VAVAVPPLNDAWRTWCRHGLYWCRVGLQCWRRRLYWYRV